MQNKRHHFLRKIYIAVSRVVATLIIGIVGFILIEGYTLSEAVYSTVIVLSTVGLGAIRTLSEEGRWFVTILILISIGIFAYGISVVSTFVFEGDLQRYFKYRKVEKKIEELKGHVIVCGFGRNGRQACEQLESHGQAFVAIEMNDKIISEMHEVSNLLFVEGDSTKDEVLLQAGIKHANAIITTLPSDAANVFVVLTARELNPKLKIISRASEDSSERKLKRAGANNVIMPDKIGGTHMATLVTRPDVLEFLDYITGKINIRLEEILYSNLNDRLKGKSIRELEIRNKTGANIIGFKTGDGDYIINPEPDTVMKPDAKLFVLGTQEQVSKLLAILKE
jgi:voltage-gated potassium channel